MSKRYRQYCPIAHALDLVGERWALLVVRELLGGPLRYSDIHERLEHCGTNILANRLRDLEAGGIIEKRRLPPPAASTVYELTDYGAELRPVVQALARWGVRSLGPPGATEEFHPGWLANALETIVAPLADLPAEAIEFRIGSEHYTLDGRSVLAGAADEPTAVVIGDARGFYHLFVDGDLDAVQIEGNDDAVRVLVEMAGLSPMVPLGV